ncbi:MAG: family 16 glycoside hydrolase [Verrucomicrobiales bacterium]
MKRTGGTWVRWGAVVIWLTGAWYSRGQMPTDGFEPIFDGRTLDGWKGQDMRFWSVEDGAITGTITREQAPTINQYLVWQGGLVDDFELKLVFRLTGSTTGDTNGGFQFRSRRLPHGDVAGYQVDNNFGQPWKVRLYDEFGRHDLALEGEQTVFTREGKKVTTPLALDPSARDFRLDEWHEYHLIAQGRQFALRINGHLVAQVLDEDDDNAEAAGVFALQLHTGPPMKAQFKDIRLKRLSMKSPLTPRARLLAEASLHWDFGERLDAHQPPLKPIGHVTADVPAEGPGAVDGTRVTRFSSGGLDPAADLNQPTLWNFPPDSGATIFIRLRSSKGHWESTWLSKGSGATSHLTLAGIKGLIGAGYELAFDFASGKIRARVPFDQSFAWQEWLIRLDGQTVNIRRNGEELLSSEWHGPRVFKSNNDPFLIGAVLVEGRPSPNFHGEMAEVALWTRSLGHEEQMELWQPGYRPAAEKRRRRILLPDGGE